MTLPTAKERLAILKRRDEILEETRLARLDAEAAVFQRMPLGERITGARQSALAIERLRVEGKLLDDQDAFLEAVAAVGPQPDDVTILAAPAGEQEPNEGEELVVLARKRLADRAILEPTQDQLFEMLSALSGGCAA